MIERNCWEYTEFSWKNVDHTNRLNRGDLKRQVEKGCLEAIPYMLNWQDWKVARLHRGELPHNTEPMFSPFIDSKRYTFVEGQFRGDGTRGYRMNDGAPILYLNVSGIIFLFREHRDWKPATVTNLSDFRAMR